MSNSNYNIDISKIIDDMELFEFRIKRNQYFLSSYITINKNE